MQQAGRQGGGNMWGRVSTCHVSSELLGTRGGREMRQDRWMVLVEAWELLGGMQPSVLPECVT